MRETCPAHLILLHLIALIFGNNRKVTVSKGKCAHVFELPIILITPTEQTPHTTTLRRSAVWMHGFALSFRIPPCTTYYTVWHVVNFPQYWLLPVGDIDYISNQTGGGEKKLCLSKSVAEATRSKRHAKTQMEFT